MHEPVSFIVLTDQTGSGLADQRERSSLCENIFALIYTRNRFISVSLMNELESRLITLITSLMES